MAASYEFQEMFRRADTNGDRRLSFEEFEVWHEREATVLLEAAPREGDILPMKLDHTRYVTKT